METEIQPSDTPVGSPADGPLFLQPPWTEHHETWLSTGSVARKWNKTEQTIRRWCASGFALQIGFRVWRDPKGRWWLRHEGT